MPSAPAASSNEQQPTAIFRRIANANDLSSAELAQLRLKDLEEQTDLIKQQTASFQSVSSNNVVTASAAATFAATITGTRYYAHTRGCFDKLYKIKTKA
jgi:hypothetical protein